ncbi:hypothetical protein Srufu_056080 [Streptomyces libani subsp. rufus]|nr:hypothetical protein Srufu_056080 [Streptomyces libani subsp. rufus]
MRRPGEQQPAAVAEGQCAALDGGSGEPGLRPESAAEETRPSAKARRSPERARTTAGIRKLVYPSVPARYGTDLSYAMGHPQWART